MFNQATSCPKTQKKINEKWKKKSKINKAENKKVKMKWKCSRQTIHNQRNINWMRHDFFDCQNVQPSLLVFQQPVQFSFSTLVAPQTTFKNSCPCHLRKSNVFHQTMFERKMCGVFANYHFASVDLVDPWNGIARSLIRWTIWKRGDQYLPINIFQIN